MNKQYLVSGILLLVIGVTTLFGYGFPARPFESASGWQVTSHLMIENGVWGNVIGTETFPTEFNYNPLRTATEREEPIGFKASLVITVYIDTVLQFTVKADDGVISLSIDDEGLIHLEAPDPDRVENSEKLLTMGNHDLELHYYQFSPVLEDDARAAYEMKEVNVTQTRFIKSGFLGLIVTGGLLVFLSQKREVNLKKAERQKDVMRIVYTFIYLVLSLYLLISIFKLS
jgi:hypothetical protein